MEVKGKVFFTLMVAMLLATSLMFAAGTQEATQDDDGSTESEEKVLRITGQSWQNQKIFIEDAAERFMEDHPDVTVEVMTYAEPSVVSNYAIDWSRGNTPVDIAVTSGAQFSAQFVAKDLIYDFETELNFFEDDFTKDEFVGVGLKNGLVKEKQYVIPLIIEAYALVINKAMFEEADLVDEDGNPLVPETWEEFYEFAEKLHIEENGQVVQQGASIQWSVMNTYATLLAVLRASRGTVYGEDGISISFDNPEFRNIMKIWKQGADEGVFSKEMFADHFAGIYSFRAGKLAMLLDSGGRWVEGAQSLGAENVTVIPFPGAAENGSYGFGSGVIIPKASPVPELAVQFIKEQLLGEYVQTRTVNQYGKMPAMTRHYEGAFAPEWQVMQEIADASGAPPTYREFARFQKGVAPILQNYLDGNLTLEEAIEDFEELVESIDKSML